MPRKQLRFVTLMLLSALPIVACIWSAAGAEKDSAQGFAVVELFTSEGCSSCPPADSLLADVVTDARKSGTPVFALAFHVDYWNRLGWADRFSDAGYSQRQSDYARALKLDDIYTPQMIVNGTDQFVGSDHTAAKRAIDAALSKPATAVVSIEMSRNSSGSYAAQYSVAGAARDTVLNFAVVERGLKTEVIRGENGGHVLRHENVVRWFQMIAIPPDGKGHVELPSLKDVNLNEASVIAYAQTAGNGPVLGATSTDFPRQ